MNHKTILGLVLGLLVIAPMVSAGTLKGDGQVDVQTDREEFDGLNMVGTWSTTPYASDTLFIRQSNVPEADEEGRNVELEETVEVEFGDPQFAERFSVDSEVPLDRATPYTFESERGITTEDQCQEALQEDLEAKGYNKYTDDFPVAYDFSGLTSWDTWCSAHTVLIESREGYVGTVSEERLSYEQSVTIGSDTVTLEADEDPGQISKTIPGKARITYTDFPSLLDRRLSSDNVFVAINKQSNTFEAYGDDTGTTVDYLSAREDLRNAEALDTPFATDLFSDLNLGPSLGRLEMERVAQTLNSEVEQVKTKFDENPSQWEGKAEFSQISSNGRNLVVPYEPEADAVSAEVQLVVNGESFGLKLLSGEPKFVETQGKVSFQEGETGSLSYSLKNVGGGEATMSVDASCNDQTVQTDREVFTLEEGETRAGEITVHSLTETTETGTVETNCKLRATDGDSGAEDETVFKTSVETKKSCVEGGLRGPYTNNEGVSIIERVNADCETVSTERCPAPNEFIREDGEWVCEQTGETCDENPDQPGCDNGDDESLNYGAILGVLIGLVGGVYSAYLVRAYTVSLRGRYKVFGYQVNLGTVRDVLTFVAVIVAFFTLPYLVNLILDFIVGAVTIDSPFSVI